MKKVYHILFLLAIVACQKKIDNKEKLTSNSIKYWKIIEVKTGKELGYNSFDKNGELLYYFRVYKTGELVEDKPHDVVMPNSWELKEKGIINMNGFDKKILKLTEDTMLVRSVKVGDSLLFLKYEYLHNLSK
jgi:hypothetical protein